MMKRPSMSMSSEEKMSSRSAQRLFSAGTGESGRSHRGGGRRCGPSGKARGFDERLAPEPQAERDGDEGGSEPKGGISGNLGASSQDSQFIDEGLPLFPEAPEQLGLPPRERRPGTRESRHSRRFTPQAGARETEREEAEGEKERGPGPGKAGDQDAFEEPEDGEEEEPGGQLVRPLPPRPGMRLTHGAVSL